MSLEFFTDIISFRSYYVPGVDSASNRNEYQKHFLGGGGRCVRLTTLPPSCAVVMKTVNLNFLEISGPLQACNGTALPLLCYQVKSVNRLTVAPKGVRNDGASSCKNVVCDPPRGLGCVESAEQLCPSKERSMKHQKVNNFHTDI